MGSPDLFPPRDLHAERRRRVLRRLGIGLVVLLLLLLVPLLWGWSILLGSRPMRDGQARVPGLSRPVAISRDDRGIPTLLCDDRMDAATALGFVHGQERFFQMDLMRRRAAGELAALVGSALVPQDTSLRRHRFRWRAQRILADSQHRDLAEAYARGVNAGLAALRARPFEYYALRARPQAWLPEDIFLVVFAMYLELQGSRGIMEISQGVIHDEMPAEVARFLTSPGSSWDALLRGTPPAAAGLPDAEAFDLRGAARVPAEAGAPAGTRHPLDRRAEVLREEESSAGSNSWAATGARTADGDAILAGDIHLGLAVPNIWYRATISFRDSTSMYGRRRLFGFTLPGVPLLIVGSNGDVAWSFTNGNFDQSDIVILETTSPGMYRTPDGPRALERHHEVIQVAGAEDETLVVHESIWGPVVHKDARGRLLVQKWVAHTPEGVNFGFLDLEQATDVIEGVQAATRSAVPGLNCILADRNGRIAWTVTGLVPRRRGLDGRLPRSWADGSRGWDGFLAPGDVPRVVDPQDGFLWSANNRPVGGTELGLLGEGGYVLGARASQIRDALATMSSSTPRDHLELQLEDRALLLERWQDLLVGVLSRENARGDVLFDEMRRFVEDWGGHASVGSVGYRIVRNYRYAVLDDLTASILAPCIAAEPSFRVWHLRERERPVWSILASRPPHLLPQPHATWDAYLLELARRTGEELTRLGPLAQRTWGERNTTRIQHPLSLAVPFLGRWLDMPREQLPGDGHIPRMQSPDWGASQRLVVIPGKEERGLAHMPVGQSGHPLSPDYDSAHEDWMQGAPTPLVPGRVEHMLQLMPEREDRGGS